MQCLNESERKPREPLEPFHISCTSGCRAAREPVRTEGGGIICTYRRPVFLTVRFFLSHGYSCLLYHLARTLQPEKQFILRAPRNKYVFGLNKQFN